MVERWGNGSCDVRVKGNATIKLGRGGSFLELGIEDCEFELELWSRAARPAWHACPPPPKDFWTLRFQMSLWGVGRGP